MEIFNPFIAFLWTLAISVEFSHESKSITRALNVGDDTTLDCVTAWDPDIDMRWVLHKNESYQFLAKAGKSFPNVEFYEYIRNDPRIAVSYYSDVNVSNLALHISNFTELDSAEYTCTSSNVLNNQFINLYFYDIRVVTCNCSIDTNVRCDLIGFDSPQWQPVTIMFNGETVRNCGGWKSSDIWF